MIETKCNCPDCTFPDCNCHEVKRRNCPTRIPKLVAALEFYKSEAEAIAKNFDVNDEALLASITILKLDAGNKAKKVLDV